MRKIKNESLAQLLMQIRFTPQKKHRKLLTSAEKLFAIIDRGKEYPFEFVCFRITGFRPKGAIGQQLIKGEQLADDLQIFIAKLSGQVAVLVSEVGEKVYTIEELAKDCSVSAKTISRWRRRGLLAERFVFDDGKKRLGVVQSTVDKFLQNNPQLITNAKRFRRLTKKEKQEVIKQATSLAKETDLSRYQIIERISADMGVVHETIRYILIEYEKANPKKRIFKRPSGVVNPVQASELYKLFKQGTGVKELMKRYNRSKSSVYRIINRRKAKELLSKKIEFIDSDEFVEETAEQKILGEKIKIKPAVPARGTESMRLGSRSLDRYLQIVKSAPALNRERETELFRRYNFLKYLASINRAGVKPTKVSSTRLKKIDCYLGQAEAIKNLIIEANLKLVVGIARKHTTSGASLLELVSEGNFSMMRAVEKFDYTRGYRFATYASWAITKDFARKIPAEAARRDKAQAASLTDVQHDLRIEEAADFAAIERAHKSLIAVIQDNLDEREQHIIINHFGLKGTLVKKEKKTLKEIGDDLDLSKERVRQIELIALQKLRHSLSPEEFDLLTG